ncbi:MAG: Gfo/Idh/MocA family oxidoreductase [bacterium]|nr:Gfo/Idh/MocA family oxidoreductase [bacterium]
MDQVRLGVVGLGLMGSRFSRLIAESPRANLTAVVDLDAARIKEVSEAWGGMGYGSVEEMLDAEPELDGLVIATPDHLHVAPSVAGAKAGKHLFVEKPLAFTQTDCRTILDAVDEAGVTLLVGHTLRFDPRYAAAREAMRGGGVGELVHTFSRRNNPSTVVDRYGDRVSVAYFLGIHDVDFLVWAMDSKVKQVYAKGRRGLLSKKGYDLDDTIFSILEWESGAVSCLENSWWVPADSPGRMYTHLFEAEGTAGEIHIVPEQTGLTLRGPGFCEYPNAVYGPEVDGRLGGVYRDEMEHFVDCIALGRAPLAPGEDARRAVGVVEAIHQSMKVGVPVDVEI